MHCSFATECAAIGELLLQHGADVNIQNEDGATALMCSCAKASIDNAKLVLRYDADVNIRDNFGRTALIDSCRMHKKC